MAAAGMNVVATDISDPTMALLARVAAHLGPRLRTIGCDAACVPLPEGSADTVLHLIERLRPDTTIAVLTEALRLARQRVVLTRPGVAHARPLAKGNTASLVAVVQRLPRSPRVLGVQVEACG
jgi:hypothetical protein